jgi:hypothetical protein
LRFAVNAMRSPAGDHFGSLSLSPAVRRRDLAPDFPASPVGKSQSSVVLSFPAMSKLVTAAQAKASVGCERRRRDALDRPQRLDRERRLADRTAGGVTRLGAGGSGHRKIPVRTMGGCDSTVCANIAALVQPTYFDTDRQ